jgi:Ca2+-binding RTX toxin-like protein
MSHRRIARVVLGQIESLESRRLLDSGDAWQHGSWTGPGITSSNADNVGHGVGYGEASAVITSFPFFATTVDQSSVLFRLTRYGDASLDGIVNLSDFNRLAGNFGSANGQWNQGDFTYDGMVNLSDFNRLAANFGISAAGPAVTPADWAALAAAVDPNNVATPQVPQVQYAVTEDGTLRVTGTKAADRIVVDTTTLANMRAHHPAVRIKRVHVDAGAGDDTVHLMIGLPSTLIGGKGNDHLTGGGRADHISAGVGADTVRGGGGNDVIEGLAGFDTIDGDAGADLIYGGADGDWLYGGSGDDTIRGGAGDDLCMGHDGNDLLYGDAGRDALYGSAGHDRFKSTDGALDTILTGPAGHRDRVLAMDDDDDVRRGTI